MAKPIKPIVRAALQGRRLVEHPFYRRWEGGRLSFDELHEYADQYRHFEASLPVTLAAIAAELEDGPIRAAVEANLADEVTPPSHLELFERFARHYGADGAAPSEAMADLLDAYRSCLRDGTTAALAGVLAYEVQGADVARTKADGLVTHYGAPEAATTFWRVHADVEDAHAQWLIDALDVESEAAAAAGASSVATAWWAFLDEREAAVAA